jgi:benzoyl-CoA 2,3-dioxygenase component A
MVARAHAYSVPEQLTWDELPAEKSPEEIGLRDQPLPVDPVAQVTVPTAQVSGKIVEPGTSTYSTASFNSTTPPWSAAHPYTQLYGPKGHAASIVATVTGNVRVTEQGREYDTHHIVLDFGSISFPVLEGQSIGIVPPGVDANGKPHKPRQYSIASARNGERPGYNNVSLTVKRVLTDHNGNPVRGTASNYVCDLRVGDKVHVVGPFGSTFLMPNHPRSNIVMICTGTGSAPMRAMTEWRRRLRESGKFEGGKLLLFFGARTKEDLPYFGPLQTLPKDFIDINFAFSRSPTQPRRYVQDAMRERATDVLKHITDPNSYFFVCGLKSMEEGVIYALRDIAQNAGLDWDKVSQELKTQSRLHMETY